MILLLTLTIIHIDNKNSNSSNSTNDTFLKLHNNNTFYHIYRDVLLVLGLVLLVVAGFCKF